MGGLVAVHASNGLRTIPDGFSLLRFSFGGWAFGIKR